MDLANCTQPALAINQLIVVTSMIVAEVGLVSLMTKPEIMPV